MNTYTETLLNVQLMMEDESSNFAILKVEIIALSQNKRWNAARREWKMRTFYANPGGTCLCTHTPITWHMVLENKLNGNLATVGNVCVGHFVRADPDDDDVGPLKEIVKPFTNTDTKALRALRADYRSCTATEILIELAWLLKTESKLTKWEYDWYRDVRKGRGSRTRFDPHHEKFSQKMYDFRAGCNRKIRDFFWR